MFTRFVLFAGLMFAAGCVLPAAESAVPTFSITSSMRVATFDVDAIPPVGSMMAYDPVTNRWELGLRARGMVMLGAGEPIVLCAVRESLPRAQPVTHLGLGEARVDQVASNRRILGPERQGPRHTLDSDQRPSAPR